MLEFALVPVGPSGKTLEFSTGKVTKGLFGSSSMIGPDRVDKDFNFFGRNSGWREIEIGEALSGDGTKTGDSKIRNMFRGWVRIGIAKKIMLNKGLA